MILRTSTRGSVLLAHAQNELPWTRSRHFQFSSRCSLMCRSQSQHQHKPLPQESKSRTENSSGSTSNSSSTSGEKENQNKTMFIPPEANPKAKVVGVIGNRFLRFLEKYQELLVKKFPGTMQVYKVFVVGFKDFLGDVKDYLAIKTKVALSPSDSGLKKLELKELEVYFQMPKDMIRVGPVLLFSALPLAQYLVFPIAYYFPRQLLSSHFWTLQQRFEFAIENQRLRMINYRPVFRHLQKSLAEDNVRDEKGKKLAQDVLNKLGSGSHPSTRQIMAIKHLFESDAFSLQAIHGPHAKRLCKSLGIHSYWLLRRSRLYEHAYMLSVMDASILRYGIFNLKNEELKFACYMRGLNGSNLTRDDCMIYLQQWMSISTTIQPHAYSLLLHLPILLSYNHPNNWALLAKQV